MNYFQFLRLARYKLFYLFYDLDTFQVNFKLGGIVRCWLQIWVGPLMLFYQIFRLFIDCFQNSRIIQCKRRHLVHSILVIIYLDATTSSLLLSLPWWLVITKILLPTLRLLLTALSLLLVHVDNQVPRKVQLNVHLFNIDTWLLLVGIRLLRLLVGIRLLSFLPATRSFYGSTPIIYRGADTTVDVWRTVRMRMIVAIYCDHVSRVKIETHWAIVIRSWRLIINCW